MSASTRRCPSCYQEKPEADFGSYKCRVCMRREEDLEGARKVSELLDIVAMTAGSSYLPIMGFDSSPSYDSTPSDSGYSGGGGDFGGGGASGDY